MLKTLTEKQIGNDLLKEYLATHKVKIASSVEELYLHSVSDDNGEEINDFLRMRQEWRNEDNDSHRRID